MISLKFNRRNHLGPFTLASAFVFTLLLTVQAFGQPPAPAPAPPPTPLQTYNAAFHSEERTQSGAVLAAAPAGATLSYSINMSIPTAAMDLTALQAQVDAKGTVAAGVIAADGDARRVSITLPQRPPSRLSCHFTKEGDERILVFDPVIDGMSLTQTITLPNAGWDLACFSDPAPQTIKIDKTTSLVDMAWQCAPPRGGQLTCEIPALKPDAAASKLTWDTSAKGIRIESHKLPDLDSATLSIRPTAKGGERFVGGIGDKLARDTLELLAEIALDRAKARGARIIEERLETFVCDELRFKVAPGAIKFSPTGELLLPHLCTAIKDTPLVELAESSAKVARALESDLAHVGFTIVEGQVPALVAETDHQVVLKEIVRILETATHRALKNRNISKVDAQLLLIDLSKADFGTTHMNLKCPAQLAFAVAAECSSRSGGCQAQDISALVRSPKDHFDLGPCNGHLNDPTADWPEITTFVSRTLDVISPPEEMSTREQYRASAVLAFDLIDFTLSRLDASSVLDGRTRRLFESVEDLTLAIIDREGRVAVTSGVAIVRDVIGDCQNNNCTKAERTAARAFHRIAPIAVALAANAESLKAEADSAEERAAQRDARKKTLEAVIDASTHRADRGGDHVFSLGANVGFRYGTEDENPFLFEQDAGNLTLPMGIAFQHLPRQWWMGYHVQLSFIDLAQFLDVDADDDEEIQWNDFALIGAQFAKTFGTSENAFSVGIDGRYYPGGRKEGQWFVGGTVAYYVPFFDFN